MKKIIERFDDKVLTLLLDWWGADIQITENVIKTAAENSSSVKEIMTLLLNWQEADIQITEDVIKVTVRNNSSEKKIMTLLLN